MCADNQVECAAECHGKRRLETTNPVTDSAVIAVDVVYGRECVLRRIMFAGKRRQAGGIVTLLVRGSPQSKDQQQ
jgi:hypothetical protein